MNTDFVLSGCRRIGAAAAGALMLMTLGMAPAHAVLSDGFFELDGNTADPSGAALPDDWNSFFNNQAHTTKATGIVTDSTPAVFRNGSKDTQDVSAWRYDLGSSPPKDDMLHAYAAAYTATATTGTTTAGDLLIYFGADRATFTGTASLGFWFFKNPIARNDATNSFVNPATNQPATHAEGDVLVAFEYTNGGAVTGVRVFRWTSGSLADLGTIGVSQTNVANVFCDPTDKICGATNSANLALPWNGTIQAGQLFEGGVNITKLLPGSDSCFAAFMATSRSSDQSNASIKNFILSNFPVCHVSVTKQCVSPTLASASTISYTIQGQVLNDGGGALSSIHITDNPALDAGSLGFFTCDANNLPTNTPASPASLASGASICYRGTFTSGTNGPSDTVTVSASTGQGSVTNTAQAFCPQLTANTGLTVTKICDLDLVAASSKLSVLVNYSGTVQNTGDVTLNNVKVCETTVAIPAGGSACDVNNATFTIGTLAPGASQSYSGTYYPIDALQGDGITSALTQPNLAVFKDKAGAEGTPPAIFGLPTVKTIPVEATCPMCGPASP